MCDKSNVLGNRLTIVHKEMNYLHIIASKMQLYM